MARREVTGKKPGVSADLIKRGSGPPDPEDAESEDDESEDDGREREKPERDEPTKHKEPAARASTKLPPVRGPPPPLAMTILEFCEAARISEGMFYKLKKQGLGPREKKVGTRTIITIAAAHEWLEAREEVTKITA